MFALHIERCHNIDSCFFNSQYRNRIERYKSIKPAYFMDQTSFLKKNISWNYSSLKIEITACNTNKQRASCHVSILNELVIFVMSSLLGIMHRPISFALVCIAFSIMILPNVEMHLLQLSRQSDKLPHQFRDQEEADKLLQYNLCLQCVINEANSLICTHWCVFLCFFFHFVSLVCINFNEYELKSGSSIHFNWLCGSVEFIKPKKSKVFFEEYFLNF